MPTRSPDAWAQIRHAYEFTDTPVEDICAAHGISSSTLRNRMRRWGWTRRRPPIPAEGPPPRAAAFAHAPTLPSPAGGGGTKEGGENGADATAAPEADEFGAPPAAPAEIVPHLKQAVMRMLPAVTENLARLGAGPTRARELEQTARALGTLTRALRELTALGGEHEEQAQDRGGGHDEVPEDIDEFRLALARQMDAIIAARDAKRAEAEAAPAPEEPRES